MWYTIFMIDRKETDKRIEEMERLGLFEEDALINPRFEPLDADKVDFDRKKFSSKVKTAFANTIGRTYLRSLIWRRKFVFGGITGIENIKGLEGGSIVTCNHCHLADHYMAFLALKKEFGFGFRLHKVIREGNYSQPGVLGMLMRNGNTVPIAQKPEDNLKLTVGCMKAVKNLLEKNKKVLVMVEQGFWPFYRKPRPLKKGAFLFSAKFMAPIIPCFLTFDDTGKMGKDGYPVVKFTFHVLPMIHPDPNLSTPENCKMMRTKNYNAWKEVYERVYGEELTYSTEWDNGG